MKVVLRDQDPTSVLLVTGYSKSLELLLRRGFLMQAKFIALPLTVIFPETFPSENPDSTYVSPRAGLQRRLLPAAKLNFHISL